MSSRMLRGVLATSQASNASIIRRRHVLLSIGSLLAGRSARAQVSAKVARVGFLTPSAASVGEPYLQSLLAGLQVLGWKQGSNMVIDARFAEGRNLDLPQLARDLLGLRPDVLVCGGPAPAEVLKKLDVKVPVIFVLVADPVGLGLVSDLAHPGGNFTGFASMESGSFVGKQIELLREIVPKASRLAILQNPTNPNHVRGRVPLRQWLNELGLKVIEVEAATRDDLEAAFSEAARQRADGMWVNGDALFVAHADLVGALALKHRIPSTFLQRQHVVAGGLMSYGPDVAGLYRSAATYIDKILKGTSPADLPVQQPTVYDLTINLKTARALGLRIPQSVLVRATELIE